MNKTKETNVERPFILEMDEAKNEIVQCINNAIQVHKLPCYILDMILSDITSQIKDGAKQELTMARQQVQNNDEEVA
jgi:hypothetical protein